MATAVVTLHKRSGVREASRLCLCRDNELPLTSIEIRKITRYTFSWVIERPAHSEQFFHLTFWNDFLNTPCKINGYSISHCFCYSLMVRERKVLRDLSLARCGGSADFGCAGFSVTREAIQFENNETTIRLSGSSAHPDRSNFPSACPQILALDSAGSWNNHIKMISSPDIVMISVLSRRKFYDEIVQNIKGSRFVINIFFNGVVWAHSIGNRPAYVAYTEYSCMHMWTMWIRQMIFGVIPLS